MVDVSGFMVPKSEFQRIDNLDDSKTNQHKGDEEQTLDVQNGIITPSIKLSWIKQNDAMDRNMGFDDLLHESQSS